MSTIDIREIDPKDPWGRQNTIQNAEIVEERTPEIVAAEIRQIADQTRKMVLNNSIEIGKRLCEAKEMVPHGEWSAWLERSVNFKQSTANNLMKIYTEYGDIQGELWGASANSQTFGNLTYSQAVALLAVPADEREEFVKENDVESMSTRELQEAIRARDEAVAAKEKAREELNDAIKSREKVIDDYCKQAENRIKKTERDLEIADKKLKLGQEQYDKLRQEAEGRNKKQTEEIEQLKKQLAATEAKEPEMPEAAQAEIKILKAKLEDAKKSAGDEETVKFKILFQNVQDEFYGLMDTVNKIKDESVREKRKYAIKVLLTQLREEVDK